MCPAAKYSEKDKCIKTKPPVNLPHHLLWINPALSPAEPLNRVYMSDRNDVYCPD